MDGHLVPNITIGPTVVKAIRKITTVELDVHLMIEEPDRYISDFAKAGADMITIHAEASTHLHRSINYIKASNAKAGVSLNPATPPHILDFVLSEVDMILVMSVNPGFGGQEFIPQSMDKIRKLRGDIRGGGFTILISVDGGINANNARDVVEAGADILVMGSAFFQSKDYKGVVQSVRKSVEGLHDTP
jgi:ribulose-phosphate 3-epimerase